jgi:FtsH-binding integral membrane protein
MSYSNAIPVPTIAEVSTAERLAYLRRVLLLTLLGLVVAGITGIASMFAIASFPVAVSGYTPMIVILGCWAVTNFVAPRMVFGTAKWAGFFVGILANGVALGFLLLVAVLVSRADFGNPFYLIGLAMLLTALAGGGLTAYALIEKREFTLLRAGLSAVFIPMLILMAVSFAFPNFFNGPLGLVVSVIFVLISAAGLLYQLNKVIHSFQTDMHVEGAFVITIGVLVLFWNILSLLLRLRRR